MLIIHLLVLSCKLVERTKKVTSDEKALSIMLLHTLCSVNLY